MLNYWNIYIYFFVTLISISHLFSPPLVLNVKCVGWSLDGSNFVGFDDKDDDLRKLRLENG
jgi:hypothetical protein